VRLHWFLPYRRGAGSSSGVRRILWALGSSWLASPWRRIIQTISLLLFLYLFLVVCWPYGSRHHADAMRAREFIEAETFLALDPLVGLSTAIAARAWVWSLGWAGALLAISLVIPRGFCGYLCPLGTSIDLVDRAIGKRGRSRRPQRRGAWVHLKYYLLTGILVASLAGVLLSGFAAAIPVLTRGLAFTIAPLQLGLARGWYLVPPMRAGEIVSIVLFLIPFALAFIAPRFWCRHVCPTGALFSAANFLRIAVRRVKETCTRCGACIAACPFDAIRSDFSTRAADCTFCQTCGGVCPMGAIEFGPRRRAAAPETGRPSSPEVAPEIALSRRGFISGAVGGGAAALAAGVPFGAGLGKPGRALLVRPPGSVPERAFLRLCIRCGECFKACPFNVLHPVGFEQGLEGIWTPRVVADWSGCDPSCTNCGQICPTGAIRALPLGEKRVARMGLAVVDEATCLPFAGREACTLCADECKAAGYDAIEFVRIRVALDGDGRPIEDSGFLAPVILPDLCVGCGLCQARCHAVHVKQTMRLAASAVRVVAGPGKEDRLASGSYRALREEERRVREGERRASQPAGDGAESYLPDFLK